MTARQQTELLQQHPLSAAFPAMAEQDLQALAIDIKEHGQREPGVIYEGKVLDGWHRYLGCQAANVPFRFVKFDGDDPVAFVKSKNWHRRHLTASQKAAIQVALHEWRKRGQSATVADSKTTADMAEAAGTSPRMIEYAKTAHKAGLGEHVREGEVTAPRAAEIARMPKARREKALREPAPRKPKVADPEVGRLKEQLSETKESLAEMADLAASAKAFEEKAEFKEMQNLRAELRAVKQRRDELMRENAELKKDLAYWKKRAGGK